MSFDIWPPNDPFSSIFTIHIVHFSRIDPRPRGGSGHFGVGFVIWPLNGLFSSIYNSHRSRWLMRPKTWSSASKANLDHRSLNECKVHRERKSQPKFGLVPHHIQEEEHTKILGVKKAIWVWAGKERAKTDGKWNLAKNYILNFQHSMPKDYLSFFSVSKAHFTFLPEK